jgi:SAM-dependent methyltransferase
MPNVATIRSSLHSIRCPLCERPALAGQSTVKDYALWACRQCRLEFLEPPPDDSALAAIYSDRYFLGEQNEEAAGRRSKMKSATAALCINELAALGRPETTELLEIGCGQGELLLEARNRGFRVSGLEVSPHAATVANRRLGTEAVRVGSINAVALPAEHFGVVVAVDVIEHVRDPKGFLTRIQELLEPGGAVLLITPSLDSWTRRFLRHHWMEYKVEHLFYFSAASMRLLLEQCGFGQIRVSPNRKVLTLDYLWRHFERFRVPLLTPLIRLLRRAVPERIAHRHLRVPASGLMAIARRPRAS